MLLRRASGANIDHIIEKIKSAIEEVGVQLKYDINVYKNVYACCGVASGLRHSGNQETRGRKDKTSRLEGCFKNLGDLRKRRD